MEPTNQSHRIVIIALVAIVFASISGGGVYYYLNQQNEAQENLIGELQKETSTEKEAKVDDSSTDETTEKDETVVNNILDIETAKIGNKVAGMVLQSIEKYSAVNNTGADVDPPLSKTNIEAKFYGKATISGTYTYVGEAEPAMLPGMLTFGVDEAFAKKVPSLKNQEGSYPIMLGKLAKEMFGVDGAKEGKSGKATIVIDNYTINRYPAEVADTATVVEIISKD